MSSWWPLAILLALASVVSIYKAFQGEWRDVFESLRFPLALFFGWVAVMLVILSNKGVI